MTLKLVPARQPHREIAAWFLSGSEPQNWLAELSRWNIPLESLVFHLIPHSDDHAISIGVLVTANSGTSFGQSTVAANWIDRSGKKAVPYAQLANRLFLPTDANLVPEVSERELTELLTGTNCDFVWHPITGLIRIEETDRRGIVDLLECPAERIAEWDCAVPGVSFHSRLMSIEAENELSVADVLSSAASDIGSQAASLDDLPPTPDEPFRGALNQWTRPLRNALRNLFKRRPQPPPQNPTPNKLEKSVSEGDVGQGSTWATQAFGFAAGAAALVGRGLGVLAAPLGIAGAAAGKLAERLASLPFIDQLARNREIDRLMHLLQEDPDRGLQFALPMGGENSRGRAIPSNELVARPIGFSLDQFGGGFAADTWNIPPDQQYKLIQQYRELAAREIRLGRYRRAAYIFAQLLGDIVSAAGALEAGNHYHEAAILYRDRLNRQGDAARCFELAGMLDEAALLFIEVGQFERAADIYVRLEREDEAERLLRSWAAQLINNGEFQNGSRVLHDKLHDVDGALDALSQGWPASASAMRCFEESFRLLGMHARHSAAFERIDEFRKVSANPRVTKMIVDGLARVSADYPELTVRAAAVDAAQVVASKVLRKSPLNDVSELLESIARLAPQDRLLARDCSRYLRNRQPVPKPAVVKKSRGIKSVSSFLISLPNVQWRVAKSAGQSAYVAGFGNNSLVLQRIEWKYPAFQNRRAFWAAISEVRQLILEPFPGDAGDTIIHPVGAEPIEKRGLPTSTGMLSSMSQAGSPTWATKSTIALAYAEGGLGWRIREVFGTLEIGCFSPKGEPLFVKDLAIPFDPVHSGGHQVTLFAAARKIRIGVGQYLCRPKLISEVSGEPFTLNEVDLVDRINGLTGARFDDNSWLITVLENGALLIDDDDHDIRFRIAETVESPCATFLGGRRFVIAGGREVHAYAIVNSRPVSIGESPLAFKPIAVTATNTLGEFAVFGEDGSVEVFQINS